MMTCCFNAEQHQQSCTQTEDRPFVFVEMMCSPPIYEVPNHQDGENIPCEVTIASACFLSLVSFFVTSSICISPPFFPLLLFPHSNSASIHPTSLLHQEAVQQCRLNFRRKHCKDKGVVSWCRLAVNFLAKAGRKTDRNQGQME